MSINTTNFRLPLNIQAEINPIWTTHWSGTVAAFIFGFVQPNTFRTAILHWEIFNPTVWVFKPWLGKNTNLARFWQTFLRDLASECINLADFLQEYCKYCVILQDSSKMTEILQGSNFLARFFHRLPTLKIFWPLKQLFPSKRKRVQCWKIFFSVWNSSDAVRCNSSDHGIKAVEEQSFCAIFEIPNKNKWFWVLYLF